MRRFLPSYYSDPSKLPSHIWKDLWLIKKGEVECFKYIHYITHITQYDIYKCEVIIMGVIPQDTSQFADPGGQKIVCSRVQCVSIFLTVNYPFDIESILNLER